MKLKELGSDYCQEIYSTCGVEYGYGDDDLESWSDDDKQMILHWLGIPDKIDMEMFKCLLPSRSPSRNSLSTPSTANNVLHDVQKWNGQLTGDEIDRLTRSFLNNEPDWAKEIEFVANRMKAKLILMNRVKVCH